MIGNRRIGGSLKNRMPMTNPLMSKSVISGAVVFFVAFFAAFISSSVLTPTKVSDATNLTTANIAFTGYFVKMNTQDVTMNLLTTPTGAMTVVDSTVKTVTNSPNGYKLYLSMSSYDTSGNEKSFNDKLKNGLYLDGDLSRTDNMVVNAAPGKGGSTASASLAALSDNTWGYAVDKNSAGAPDIWLNENHSTMSSTTPTNDKFAAVPKATEVDLIQETSSSNLSYNASESDVQDSDYTDANLYYGIRGNAGLQGGSYTNTIAYTAVGKTEPSGTLTFNPASYTFSAPYESMTWTDTVTIQTPLYTSAEDLGTATVTLGGGPDNVSGLACSNPTLSVYNNLLNITCTLPQAHAGNYDVLVYLDKYGQIYTGNYTYNDPYSASYTVTMNKSNVDTNVDSLSIPYGGTALVEATPESGYYLSSVVCPSGYRCSNYSTGYAAKNKQTIIVTNLNTTEGGEIVFTGSTYTTIADATYMQDVTGCPSTVTEGQEYKLVDKGEPEKSYKVARLADGKCWMTSNYNVSGGKTLTPSYYNTQNNYTLPNSSTSGWSDVNTAYVYNNSTYGGYYSYAAITAGINPNVWGINSPYDICPKGWRLPTRYEFNGLINAYSASSAGDVLLQSPINMLYGGVCDYDRGCPYDAGSKGYYYSSTSGGNISNIGTADYLFFNSSRADTDTNHGYYKYAGMSIRCVTNN